MNKTLIIASALLFGVAFASGALAGEGLGEEINPATAPQTELKKVDQAGGPLEDSKELGAEISNPATTPERQMTEGKKSGKKQMKVKDEVKEPGAEIDPVTAPKI